MLERLVPDPEFRRQLQALFDGNEALRRQFPGGVVQFAQIAGQFPEVLDDLMIAQFAGDQGGAGAGGGVPVQFGDGGMPGGMPDEQGDDVDTDDENDLPARDAGPAGVGARAEEGEEDDEEDEETEVAVRHALITGLLNTDRSRLRPFSLFPFVCFGMFSIGSGVVDKSHKTNRLMKKGMLILLRAKMMLIESQVVKKTRER